MSLTGSLSDGAYAVFDTSGLSAGTYIMPFEMSKKTIIYFSSISDFIFKVAE